MKNFSIIIPARFKSSRFPGKPLAKIKGIEMIIRVCKICNKVLPKNKIFVATDNLKIKKVVEDNFFKSILVKKKCFTGTDRVYEASKKIKSKYILNVQGDEPIINPNDIKKIMKAKIKSQKKVICGYSLIKYLEAKSLNIPKVVINEKSELIYMSRAVVPSNKKINKKSKIFKQVCIYGFNKQELLRFNTFGRKSKVEQLEDIEILRFMELGIPIQMVKLSNQSIAVDIKSDIRKVELKIK